MPEYFYIVDGHALIHRGFHAPFRELTAPDGEPTKATYLYTRWLLKIIREKQPSYIVVCCDSNRETLRRRKAYPDYKANRKAPDPALRIQVERCKVLTKAFGICVLEKEGYEADDLIATLTRKCVSDEVHVRIVARDKDMMCLLADPRVRMYDPSTDETIGPKYVMKRHGVKPEQMTDYLAMVGDSVDNIPGVKGIGPKIAARLLSRYHNLLGIGIQQLGVKSPDDPDLKTFVRCNGNGRDIAKSQQLVRLDDRVPLKWPRGALRCNGVDVRKARVIFRSLGFRKWE